jgi:toluene monooxygenase system protein D
MTNKVGPILRMGAEVDLVLAAILEDNPERSITVVDRGAYVRIEAEDHLIVSQATLRRHLGESYEIRSLETIMSSFQGRIVTTSDAVIWENVTRPAAAPRRAP